MKLELKHIAPYLPYNLSVFIEDFGIESLKGVAFGEVITEHDNAAFESTKPILRPLSDLIKEIEVNGDRFVPLERMFKGRLPYLSQEEIDDMIKWPLIKPYATVSQFHEMHFDTFGLIDAGLALDINQLTEG